MNTSANSRFSFDSTLNGENSTSSLNLNQAMLLSIDEDALSNSGDEIFFDVYDEFPTPTECVVKESTSVDDVGNTEQRKIISRLFDDSDNPSIVPLPKRYLNQQRRPDDESVECKSNPVQNSIDPRWNEVKEEADTNRASDCHETHKRPPLRVILKNMFDSFLRKHNTHAERSNTRPNKTAIDELLSNHSNVNLPSSRLDHAFERNNNNNNNNNNNTNNNNNNNHNNNNNYHNSNNNNNYHLDEIEKSSTSIRSTGSKDYSKSDVSFPEKNLDSMKLDTILEHSNESAGTLRAESVINWSGKYIGSLANFVSDKFRNNRFAGEKIFVTSDIDCNDSNASTTYTSSDIDTTSNDIYESTDYSRAIDFLNCTPRSVRDDATYSCDGDYATYTNIRSMTNDTDAVLETENDSSTTEDKRFDSSDCSSGLGNSDNCSTLHSTTKIDSIEASTMNQDTQEESIVSIDKVVDMEFREESIVDDVKISPSRVQDKCTPKSFRFDLLRKVSIASPIFKESTRKKSITRNLTPKKSVKKRRSSSFPGNFCEGENNKGWKARQSNSKSPHKGRFYDKTNTNMEWGYCSPTYPARRSSICVIASPIKPVAYLKTFFTNIANKNRGNAKRSPRVYKLRPKGMPFITVTPATPT